MGSTRSHPLPAGIFMEMPPTNEELIEEIKRLRQRVKELESRKVTRVDYEEVVLDPPDDDDIMHDPDVREMVEMVNTPVTCLTHLAKRVKMMRKRPKKMLTSYVHTFVNHRRVGRFLFRMYET